MSDIIRINTNHFKKFLHNTTHNGKIDEVIIDITKNGTIIRANSSNTIFKRGFSSKIKGDMSIILTKSNVLLKLLDRYKDSEIGLKQENNAIKIFTDKREAQTELAADKIVEIFDDNIFYGIIKTKIDDNDQKIEMQLSTDFMQAIKSNIETVKSIGSFESLYFEAGDIFRAKVKGGGNMIEEKFNTVTGKGLDVIGIGAIEFFNYILESPIEFKFAPLLPMIFEQKNEDMEIITIIAPKIDEEDPIVIEERERLAAIESKKRSQGGEE